MSEQLKKAGFLAFLETISTKINTIAEWICVISSVALFSTLNIGVFSRYILNSPVIWSEEVARFLMIWLAFVGSSVVFRRRELVNFQFFLNILPHKVFKVVTIFIQIAVLLFLVGFLKIGIGSMELFKKSTASATQISLFWPALGLIVGGVFMLVHSLCFLFNDLVNFGSLKKEGQD